MATILFMPLLELGHISPTLPISRTLRARGHRIVYFVQRPRFAAEHQRWRAYFTDRGLEAHFALEPWLVDAGPDRPSTLRSATLRGLVEMLREASYRKRALALLAAGRVEEQLRAIGPDLVLTDTDEPFLSLVAMGMGIAVAQFATNFFGADPSVPRRPPRHWLGQARWHRRMQRLRLLPDLTRAARALAARVGYPDAAIDGTLPLQPFLRGHLPLLVFWPKTLYASADPRAIYLGCAIDRDRASTPLPLEWVDPARPLVYCALGSKVDEYAGGASFFDRLFAVLREHPEWQLLAAVGKRAKTMTDLPPNVRVVAFAPQLDVLARATIMISHAGLGSVKEALSAGVPILAVPIRYDQPANAQVVERLGAGLTADLLSTTTELGCQLARLLGEPAFRTRCAELAEALVSRPTAEADAIEALLPAAPR